MPWSIGNIPDAFKSLSKEKKRLAISIANGVLRSCLKDGGTDKECAPKAIRVALAKVKEKKVKEEATVQATETVAAAVTEEAMLTDDLSLSVSLSESGIKDEGGVVKATECLIEQGWSLNKRFYSSSLLRKLAPILDGAGSIDGHIPNPRFKDCVGVHRSVRFAEGAGPTGKDAIIGEFHAIDSHLQRIIKHAPTLVKLSINGKGKIRRGTAEGQEGFIVEDVDTEIPWTCDAVFVAGARGGIGDVLEALELDGGTNMDLNTIQDLKNAYPKLLEEYADEVRSSVAAELQEQGETVKLKADIKEAQDELAKTVKQRDEALRKIAIVESRNLLEKKLGESKLHESLKALVRKQFADAIAEDAAVDALLKEYTDLAASLAEPVKVEGVKEEADNASENDWELLNDVLGLKDGE
ncbi:MAG: hypothetical protein WC565_06250 [Parcubacteria group bacterium]|jgi:uncharacterized protein YdaT